MKLLKQATWRIFQGIGGALIVAGALIQLAGMRFWGGSDGARKNRQG